MRDEIFIDLIGEIERYFEYENVHDPNQVRFATTKLKGHVALWWDMLQRDKTKHRLERIRTWKKMVNKLREKFFPADYQQSVCT